MKWSLLSLCTFVNNIGLVFHHPILGVPNIDQPRGWFTQRLSAPASHLGCTFQRWTTTGPSPGTPEMNIFLLWKQNLPSGDQTCQWCNGKSPLCRWLFPLRPSSIGVYKLPRSTTGRYWFLFSWFKHIQTMSVVGHVSPESQVSSAPTHSETWTSIHSQVMNMTHI